MKATSRPQQSSSQERLRLPSPTRLFFTALLLTLLFRLWLASVFPMTGDEAYFIEWGKRPDWGFYDHPPMIGWWLAGLLSVTDAAWWLRLPQVLQPALLALAVRWAYPCLWPARSQPVSPQPIFSQPSHPSQPLGRARDDDPFAAPESTNAARDWVALLVLLAPVNLWNVFITTDTALVYFSVLSGLAWLRAARDDSLRWYAVAGVLLAGAVLSKYFVALLGFAYLVDVLRRRSRGAWAGLLLAYALCVPGLALMAWWNSEHCWANYMFNFVNRHGEGNTALGWQTPLLYGATLLYVLTPPLLWRLLRPSRLANADFLPERTLAVLLAVPLLLFAALSLFKTIGLHWVLSFVPFALLLVVRRLSPGGLPRLVLFFMGFAALHIAAVLLVSRLPLENWARFKFYPGLVLTFESEALLQRAAPGTALLASDGYSNAVIIGYHTRRHVPVLGPGSGHARHDDILTDWREHAGRDIVVLRKTALDDAEQAAYRRWFGELTIERFEHRGASFWVVRGQRFNYLAYRDEVLETVRRRFYAIPAWLPQRGCYFCERYFSAQPGRGPCIR